MVDEPREVAALGGVDDVVLVDPEEVGRSDALLLVSLLPDVGDERPEKQWCKNLIRRSIAKREFNCRAIIA